MTKKEELAQALKAARFLMGADDLDITPSAEVVPSGESGYWVAAWVYISKDDVNSTLEGKDK